MKNVNVNYLIGEDIIKVQPLEPYSEIVCNFMDDFSKKLRLDKRTAAYSDVMSLSFWCRKANIVRLKEEFGSRRLRIGRGLVFHITPSNVPVNFAFSYFFGLLSGNCNIVRIPSRKYDQISIICDALNYVILQDKYVQIKDMTAFVSYQRDDEVTAYFSSKCDVRVIWGGDDTINSIRQFPIKERTIEIVFADRYSLGIINYEEILKMNHVDLKGLAEKFYNDTYLMDQNACSTPHLLLWYGANDENKERAKKIFWDMVYKASLKYDLTPIKSIDKYSQLCRICMERNDFKKIDYYNNYLYTIDLKALPDDISDLRGKFGLFFECNIENIEEMAPYINYKIQTLTYVGMDKKELALFVIEYHLQGIDRIVPMGSSLEMGVYWDGYDIINNMSRCVDFR